MSRRRTITRRLAAKLLFRFEYRCQVCAELVDDLHEFDHVVPLWAGGRDHEDNLQLLCYACHGRKTRDESDLYTAYRRACRSLAKPASERVCWKCTTVYSKYFQHTCSAALADV
jgi:hypothetical protein